MSNNTNPGERGRFSAPRKAATVLRLLRGESLELLARELGVRAATLAGWRDDFLAGGQAALKSRPTDDRDEEIARLRAKVGELTMDNELLLPRCRADRPFRTRNSWVTSGASSPSRRSMARVTARSGPGSASKASGPRRSASAG
jgi:transposase-like protein